MKRVNNKYIFIFGFVLGLIVSVTSVYAIDAYIESNKVTYTNHNKTNVEEAIDELYERSGIHKEKWIDPILNGADPVLKEPLIPVEIKPNGDVYYANENSEWYNYSEKRWANAVILNDNVSHNVGDKIDDKDIKGYFVWIPRYSYKIWNEGNYSDVISVITNSQGTAQDESALWRINREKIINIKFVGTDTIETGSKVDEYLTHPAFKLGNKTLSGIWVGKFETGGSIDSLIVKPNVISLRNQTVKVFFDAAKKFTSTELDSHMMKNTEWGAVAYLSHSQYGIGNEVNINNESNFYTGYSSAPGANQSTFSGEQAPNNVSDKTQPWNTPVGYLASTTGDITGIYDMSGGAWDHMAACIDGFPGKSGFKAETLKQEMDNGYIDKYDKNSVVTSYNNRILGDAIGEMGPFYNYYEGNGYSYNHSWYGDDAYFIHPDNPWLLRGGDHSFGVLAGQFSFSWLTGGAGDNLGFRLVLAPTK